MMIVQGLEVKPSWGKYLHKMNGTQEKERFLFFLMAKLFEGNSFLTRVYMREEHFLGFISNEEAPSFGLSNTLDFGSQSLEFWPQRQVSSEKLAVLHCF